MPPSHAAMSGRKPCISFGGDDPVLRYIRRRTVPLYKLPDEQRAASIERAGASLSSSRIRRSREAGTYGQRPIRINGTTAYAHVPAENLRRRVPRTTPLPPRGLENNPDARSPAARLQSDRKTAGGNADISEYVIFISIFQFTALSDPTSRLPLQSPIPTKTMRDRPAQPRRSGSEMRIGDPAFIAQRPF